MPTLSKKQNLKDWRLERLGRTSAAVEPSAKTRDFNARQAAAERIKGAASVGLVIVGDEVLRGKVSSTLCSLSVFHSLLSLCLGLSALYSRQAS